MWGCILTGLIAPYLTARQMQAQSHFRTTIGWTQIQQYFSCTHARTCVTKLTVTIYNYGLVVISSTPYSVTFRFKPQQRQSFLHRDLVPANLAEFSNSMLFSAFDAQCSSLKTVLLYSSPSNKLPLLWITVEHFLATLLFHTRYL